MHGSEYDSGKGKSKSIVSRLSGAFRLADGLASEKRVPKKGDFWESNRKIEWRRGVSCVSLNISNRVLSNRGEVRSQVQIQARSNIVCLSKRA